MSSFNAVIEKTKKIWPAQLFKSGVLNMRLVWLGILGVILLISGGLLDSQPNKSKVETPAEVAKSAPAQVRNYEEALEAKLANLLSQVKGAGAVAVNITLENGGTQEPARNITKESKTIQEKDTGGGIRTTTEIKETEQILLSKENGVDHPVMLRELKPVIKGVLVIAEGAYDSTVKANLTRAVEAGLGIPAYKITVIPQRK